MATITLSYKSNSVQAKKAIDYMLSTGLFSIMEPPLQRRLRKSFENAEKIAADIRQNGPAGHKTLDDLIAEIRAEE